MLSEISLGRRRLREEEVNAACFGFSEETVVEDGEVYERFS